MSQRSQSITYADAERVAKEAEQAVANSVERLASWKARSRRSSTGTQYRSLETQADHDEPLDGSMPPGDSSNTERSECFPVIIPEGTWKEKWDVWILVLILYSAVAVPFRVCFDADAIGLMWLFEVAMSFFFLVDVALTFRTAYFADGQWVTNPAKIASRYASSWLWIDAPSSLPLELCALISHARTRRDARTCHRPCGPLACLIPSAARTSTASTCCRCWTPPTFSCYAFFGCCGCCA